MVIRTAVIVQMRLITSARSVQLTCSSVNLMIASPRVGCAMEKRTVTMVKMSPDVILGM